MKVGKNEKVIAVLFFVRLHTIIHEACKKIVSLAAVFWDVTQRSLPLTSQKTAAQETSKKTERPKSNSKNVTLETVLTFQQIRTKLEILKTSETLMAQNDISNT